MTSPTANIVAGTVLFILQAWSPADAQIATDGTLGSAGALAGPNFAITADLGRQLGANLFHSFSTFNLASGQSATFSGPGNVANIISRVTGGSASSIDGLIRSTIGGANLFLINPKGIAFGPNAQLDLSGSFHASTADYIKFGDGGRFDASNPAASILTAAPPEAFGFLSSGPAPIAVQGSQWEMQPGTSLSIVGGDLTLDGARFRTQGGDLRLAGMTGASEFPIRSPLRTDAGSTTGRVVMTDTQLTADGSDSGPPGAILIQGGDVMLSSSQLASSNASPAAASPIEIQAGDVRFVGGSVIQTFGYLAGAAADIRLSASRNVLISDGSSIGSITFGVGSAGSITLGGTDVRISGGSTLFSSSLPPDASGTSIGTTGSITITAARIAIDGASAIGNASFGGPSGSISMTASESFDLIEGDIVSVAQGRTGQGGDILISAPMARVWRLGNLLSANDALFADAAASSGTVRIEGASIGLAGNIFTSTVNSGAGGNIDIFGGVVAVPVGRIDASTAASGQGGRISLDAADRLEIGDQASPLLAARFGSDFVRSALTVPAGSLYSRFAVITTSTNLDPNNATFGGSGGRVLLASPNLTLGADARILAQSVAGDGSGGAVRISADRLSIKGGQIDVSTAGAGIGGDVEISAGSVELNSGASISASSTAGGTAGSIAIVASDAVRLNGSRISTSASTSDGGNISIRAGNLVHLKNSEITTSVGSGQGSGGNIFIDPTFVILDGASITANAFGGPGGSITIISDYFFATPDSLVEASSQLGVSGSVQIAAPRTDPGSALARLSTATLDASSLLRASCTGRAGPGASTFLGIGRGGIASDPAALAGSRYFDAATSREPHVPPAAASTHRGAPNWYGTGASVLLASDCAGK